MKQRMVPAGTVITYKHAESDSVVSSYRVTDVDVAPTTDRRDFRPYRPDSGSINEYVADLIWLVMGQSRYYVNVVLPDGSPLDAQALFESVQERA